MSSLFAVVLLLAAAKEPYKERVFDPSGLDPATIQSMADRGTFLVVDENDKGKPELVTAGVVIDATPETVYGVVTDYAHFTEFMPQLEECKVVKEREDGTRDVEFSLKFKVSVMTQRLNYTARFHTYVPNRKVAFEFIKGDLKDGGGSYLLVPFENGKKTILFYSTISDATQTGYFARKLIEDQPQMEGAMMVSTASVVSGAVKKRAEKIEAKKAQPEAALRRGWGSGGEAPGNSVGAVR